MMMAVAGLLVMNMVVPRLAAKNGKGFFCLVVVCSTGRE